MALKSKGYLILGYRKGCLVPAAARLPTESVLEYVTSFPSKEKVGLIISPYVCGCFLRYILCLQLFFFFPLRVFLCDS